MKLSKFLTPPIWKTIWTQNIDCYKSSFGRSIETEGFIIVKVATNKNNRFKCYISDSSGETTRSITDVFLFNKFPEVKQLLKENGIKFE